LDGIEFLCLLKSELWNNPLACAAILVSMAALGLAVYEGWATRKHNRLSVLPHLVPEFRLSEILNPFIGLYLVNSGLGPGKILEFIIEANDGTQVDGSTPQLAKITRRLNSEGKRSISLSAITPNQMIKANEAIPVISMKPNENSAVAVTNFIEWLYEMKAKVKYEDLYGKQFESDWKKGIDLVLKQNG